MALNLARNGDTSGDRSRAAIACEFGGLPLAGMRERAGYRECENLAVL
jgi:hypothetical protein